MNPFPTTDPDRHAIWEMLVERDILAFTHADWQLVAEDFLADEFHAIDARRHSNPDSWQLAYPDLDAYRDAWLKQAVDFQSAHVGADPVAALHALTTLRDIEINGTRAVVHKKFDGSLQLRDGEQTLCWQTLYHCRKVEGTWKICGFTGYLPNPMGETARPPAPPAKRLPEGASQHTTAGPYSPVLEINPGKLVVISGQAALDHHGHVIGETIEEQTRLTLENCFAQLASAGCTPADVFKVNIFMTDLAEWPRLNAVYQEMMPPPRPVRTAVQAGLLFTLKVEIEMWGGAAVIWDQCTSAEIAAADRSRVVILPLAATEQHGPHLPLATDRLIAEGIGTALEARLGERILLLPFPPVGYSMHHRGFAGTLSVTHRQLIDTAASILACVFADGFKNVLILNAHGGNIALGGVLLESLGESFPDARIAFTNWWQAAADSLRGLSETGPGGTGHACEFETSLLLHLHPHLVRTAEIAAGTNQATFPWAESDMLQGSPVRLQRSFSQMTSNGVFGDPRSASAAKGEAILAAVVAALSPILTDLSDS